MDNDDIEDMFRRFGQVSIRRMFGGKGIYIDGVICALIFRDELLLKGDAETGPLIEAAGGIRWTYENSKSGKVAAMPYWSMPSSAYDDDDERMEWAKLAVEAGYRATKS